MWDESVALGCEVEWGERDRMPDSRDRLYEIGDEITIPPDRLPRPGCKVPLDAPYANMRLHSDEATRPQ